MWDLIASIPYQCLSFWFETKVHIHKQSAVEISSQCTSSQVARVDFFDLYRVKEACIVYIFSKS